MRCRCLLLFVFALLSLTAMAENKFAAPSSRSRSSVAEVPRPLDLSSKESIIFFPALARRDGNFWDIEIRGWIFKQERRRGAPLLLRKYLGVDLSDLTAAEQNLFSTRTKLFLIDAKGGRKISIQLGDKTYYIGASKGDGQFSGTLRLPTPDASELLKKLAASSQNIFHAVIGEKDQRDFGGSIEFVDDTGISVISDIDDTIKLSNVREKKTLLRNTFCHTFEVVPGMSDIYRQWSTNQNARFHYISASPCQLYPPLADFLNSQTFPRGTIHLRAWHWSGELLPHRTPVSQTYKLSVIRPLLKKFPNRHFVLVGDSGEFDPETYGIIAREFPKQVDKIFIRNVTSEARTSDRYNKAFEKIPAEKWQLFKAPSEMKLP